MAEGGRTTSKSALRVVAKVLACLAVMVALAPAIASAAGRVEFLAERLRYPPPAGQADDFRVRTNAALALGATDDNDAVVPLCDGLGDPSEVVRQAAAVALRRLARTSSLDCLRRRFPAETNSAVKLQIQRAIEVVEGAGGGSGGGSSGGNTAPYVAGAKYYV